MCGDFLLGLYNPGITGETAGIAGIGGDGQIRFYSNQPVHVVTDVDGYFSTSASGMGFVPTASPSRLLDSRGTAYHGNGQYDLKVAGVTGPGGVNIPAEARVLVCTAAAVG